MASNVTKFFQSARRKWKLQTSCVRAQSNWLCFNIRRNKINFLILRFLVNIGFECLIIFPTWETKEKIAPVSCDIIDYTLPNYYERYICSCVTALSNGLCFKIRKYKINLSILRILVSNGFQCLIIFPICQTRVETANSVFESTE